MLDGDLLWDKAIIDRMTEKKVSAGKNIRTFLNLPENLYEALKKTACTYPEKTALVDNDGTSYSYVELLQRTEQTALYFYKKLGDTKAVHIGILMHNSAAYCILFLALMKLRATIVPLPTKYTKKEVLQLAARADTEHLICEEEYASWFDGIYDENQITSVKAGALPDLCIRSLYECKACDSIAGGGADDCALIMFTSGTTSQSKGVMLKNYNIMHAVEAYRRTLKTNSSDSSIIATPIYHITGLVALLGLFIYVGGTLYIHKFFDAKRMIQDCRTYSITFLHASPTVFNLLLQYGENTPKIASLTTLACGSGNITKDKLMRIRKWLPDSTFHTVYGLTETTSPATVFPEDAATSAHIGSSGIPIPGVSVKIVDDEQNELPANTVGEIAVSGSVVLHSYYKQEADTLQGSWLFTGDLGFYNQAGYLYIVDRKKNMINRGGEKIWCYDVENEIEAMNGVVNVAVAGVPDELYGEVPAAVVEVTDGSGLTPKAIQDYLSSRIAKYKIPVKIKIVAEIPQTLNGKIDKVSVKKLLMEET